MAYLLDGTVGLPGMEAGGLLEPAGILAKTLEALFLVLCAFELVTGFGRMALSIGIAAVLTMAGLAAALVPLGVAGPTDHDGAHDDPEPMPSQHHDK